MALCVNSRITERMIFIGSSTERRCLPAHYQVRSPGPLSHAVFTLSIHIHQHQRAIHLPDWKMGSEESLTFTLCWIVLTWHLTCWLMRNVTAWRKSKVKMNGREGGGPRHNSEPQLFINILVGPAPIHRALCYTSRIGSVISGIYLHLSRGSPVCVCLCVFDRTELVYLKWSLVRILTPLHCSFFYEHIAGDKTAFLTLRKYSCLINPAQTYVDFFFPNSSPLTTNTIASNSSARLIIMLMHCETIPPWLNTRAALRKLNL